MESETETYLDRRETEMRVKYTGKRNRQKGEAGKHIESREAIKRTK